MKHRIIELGHALSPTAPAGPTSPAFERSVHYEYQPFNPTETVTPETIVAMSDSITMGSHTGTHMDSLLHVGTASSFHRGDPLPPFYGRGVLLDLPRLRGEKIIGGDLVVDASIIREGLAALSVTVRPGDALLVRTGRDTLAGDPEAYAAVPLPGVDFSGARYMVDLGVVLTGADTIPFECVPSERPLEVHAELLYRSGVPILENLDLRALSAAGVVEFDLVVAPMRIVGGSASPVNPLAILS